MLIKIILLLTLTPLLELLLLLKIADLTGIAFTLLLVIATGILGGTLAKMEGLRVLEQIRSELHRNQLPADPLIEGAMVLLAGALLLTPGVITDAIGFILLAPPGRKLIRVYLKKKLKKMAEHGSVHIHRNMGFGPINHTPPPGFPPVEENTDYDEVKKNANDRQTGR